MSESESSMHWIVIRSQCVAVVLLSGGLDSYTAAAIARSEGFELHALTVDTASDTRASSRPRGASRRRSASSAHLELEVDLRGIGGSALTSETPVPRDRERAGAGIPVTYVPARNTIFLSLALGWAEVLGARDIVIGVNALDYSGYPDCRPEFIDAFETLAALATRAGVEGARFRVHTPLIALRRPTSSGAALALGLDYR